MSRSELVLLVLSALALAAILWHALLLWLASRLVPERAPDEVYKVACEDGWVIELARYRGNGARLAPVIFCHGIGANSISLDLAEEISLPRFLRARGFDCWLLDLRGRGGSARPPLGRGPYDYGFSDHVRFDVKAAIDLVRRETGASKVAWIGHSLGGMSIYAHCEEFGDDALAAAVVCGSPVTWEQRPLLAPLARYSRLHALPAIYQTLPARLLAPLAGFWSPPVAKLLLNPRNMKGPHMRLGLARALANMSMRSINELSAWITTGEMRSGDRVYFKDLARIRVPWLAIGGEEDRLVPPENVRAAIDRLGSTEKRWLLAGKASGHAEGYGHIDLLLGSRCREEVFAPIAEFLAAHALREEVRARAAAAP